jgi:endoglucanase Acf2
MKLPKLLNKGVDAKDTVRETADNHVINPEISSESIVISVKQLQNFMDNVMKNLDKLSARIQLSNSKLSAEMKMIIEILLNKSK